MLVSNSKPWSKAFVFTSSASRMRGWSTKKKNKYVDAIRRLTNADVSMN